MSAEHIRLRDQGFIRMSASGQWIPTQKGWERYYELQLLDQICDPPRRDSSSKQTAKKPA